MENTYQTQNINGYKVSIYTGYNGVQLFISNPQGDEIYAHRVSGTVRDAQTRAMIIIATDNK